MNTPSHILCVCAAMMRRLWALVEESGLVCLLIEHAWVDVGGETHWEERGTETYAGRVGITGGEVYTPYWVCSRCPAETCGTSMYGSLGTP